MQTRLLGQGLARRCAANQSFWSRPASHCGLVVENLFPVCNGRGGRCLSMVAKEQGSTQRPRTLSSLQGNEEKREGGIVKQLEKNYEKSKQTKRVVSSGNVNLLDKKRRMDSMQEFRENVDIRLLQYCRDPRSHQFRALMDYFSIPYNAIEVTPSRTTEFEMLGVDKEKQRVPFVTVFKKNVFKQEYEAFKQRATKLVSDQWQLAQQQTSNTDATSTSEESEKIESKPQASWKNMLSIAHPETFKSQMEDVIKKNNGKLSEEGVKELLEKFNQLFEYHDKKVASQTYDFFHDDLVSAFIPWIKKTISNNNKGEDDKMTQFFNCDESDINFYSNEFVDLVEFNQVKSFSRACQLYEYTQNLRTTRNFGKFKVDYLHLDNAFNARFRQKRVIKKRLKNSESTYLPWNSGIDGILIRFMETLKRDRDVKGQLITKSFHGGDKPDILDVLVCGALRSSVELDMFGKLPQASSAFETWYSQINDEIGDTACVKQE